MILYKQGIDPQQKLKELEARIITLEEKINGRSQTQGYSRARNKRGHRLHRE